MYKQMVSFIAEHPDDTEPDLFDSESSSDPDEEPELSNVVVYIRFIRKKNIGRQTATRIHEQKA